MSKEKDVDGFKPECGYAEDVAQDVFGQVDRDPLGQQDQMSPAGWMLWFIPVDGGQPQALNRQPKSWTWCKRMIEAWDQSAMNTGSFELAIEPAKGWSSIQGDPVWALCHAICDGTLSPELGATRLRILLQGGKWSPAELRTNIMKNE